MGKKFLLFKMMCFNLVSTSKYKAEAIRKSRIFKEYGEGGRWKPTWLPAHPHLISIGNNVTVSADVRFYEHDVVGRMWNHDKEYTGPRIAYYTGEIKVEDNVLLGARSIILYNVTIGKNALVAAGSVVVNDVPPYAIVAGNPAKVIGDTRDLYKKRLEYTNKLKGEKNEK